MKRIMLIVDDDDINRGLLESIFEDEFRLITAKDGNTALAQLSHYGSKISIVLLDLVMPGMDGLEVLEEMRESAEMRSVPVIVVSGQEEKEEGLEAIRCGAADFVTKPVEPELIRIKVDSAISKTENARLRAENDYSLLQSKKEAKYHTVLESTGTVAVEFDRLDGIYQYDPSISKYIAGTFDGRRLWQILMSDMVADVMDVKAMQGLVYNVASDPERNSGSMTVRLKTPSGDRQWFRMQIFRQPGESIGNGKMMLTFNNVNDEILAAEKLRFQAERDALTGLYNRLTFFEKAAGVIAEQEPGYYIMACFDIDKFKVINDQYGSERGDLVLRQVAELLSNEFEPVGGMVGRISADNFAALYPVSVLKSGKLEKFADAVMLLDGSLPPLSFSIGRYLVDDLSLPPSAMYDRAAIAKASVKGRYDVHFAWYDESMRAHLIHEQELVNEMKPALEDGQFEIWLQPQYNHSTKALIGAEVLVRWRHPVKGIVPPGEFISVFERNGFIYEMDKCVWRQACALLRKWMDEGRRPLPLSVNISRYDLFHGDLTEFITGLVRQYGIPIDLLRLEITESAFAKSTEQVVSIVKSLIECGFTVEIDDFGSGYSSLNTLKDVPAQVLKLDMRFLENSEDSDRGGNVLESVVRMAKWLGMAVIAEGVETIEQADYLKSIGCTYVQGYLYAEPMPVREYEALAQGTGKEEKLLALETVKNLNNSAFWDPKSMDTLIFNSYVGAASIIEYHNGEVELLRASEKFLQMFGSEELSTEDMQRLDWMKYLEEESAVAFQNAVQHSIKTNDEITVESVFINLPGSREKIYLRVTLRVIATVGDHYLIYCTNVNITDQRKTESKERKAMEQLQLLNDMASELLAVTDAVDSINRVLVMIRECFGGDRAFIFECDAERNLCSFTYEACSEGVAPCREKYSSFPLKNAWYWQETFQKQRFLRIDTEEKLGKDRRKEAQMLQAMGARSVIAVTMQYGGRNIGNLGVFNPTLHLDDYENLRALADYMAIILTRRDLHAKIANDREVLQTMMDDTPGGFARLRIRSDGSVTTEYVNDNFCDLCGMTREEILSGDGQDAMGVVHPDDLRMVRRTVREMVATGEMRSIRYRLKHANGSHISLSVLGRVTRDDDGAQYINAYYADLSERMES